MKTSPLKFIMGLLAYAVPTMILGVVWHFVLFAALYEELGIYNREDPIIPLGFASMIIQGAILSYLYPYYAGDKSSVGRGIGFGLIMGLFLFSVSTLANAAKIEVTSMQTWLGIQLLFHVIQFVIAGALIGVVFGSRSGVAAVQ